MEKLFNFKALKKSFSMHKEHHLVKPVLIIAPGFILEIQNLLF